MVQAAGRHLWQCSNSTIVNPGLLNAVATCSGPGTIGEFILPTGWEGTPDDGVVWTGGFFYEDNIPQLTLLYVPGNVTTYFELQNPQKPGETTVPGALSNARWPINFVNGSLPGITNGAYWVRSDTSGGETPTECPPIVETLAIPFSATYTIYACLPSDNDGTFSSHHPPLPPPHQKVTLVVWCSLLFS